jgi:tetratricopeptide (TPR) repeat protein
VARLGEARGAWDRAEAALAKLLEGAEGPAHVGLALRLAQAREHLGDSAGVEAALQRGLGLDARHPEVRGRLRELYERNQAWQALADLLVGDADLVDLPAGPPPSLPPGASIPPPSGSTAEAIRLYRRAAEIHTTKRGAPQDAIPVLERAALLAPFDRELLLTLGDAYTAAGRERDAMTVLERVIASFGAKRTKEMAVYHHRLAKAFAAMGDRQAALGQLDTAFKIDPGSVVVLRDLGVLAFEAEDLDRAQKTFRALLLQRLDGASGISKGEVFYYLGQISARQGDVARAVQMFERALENEPTHGKAREQLSALKG